MTQIHGPAAASPDEPEAANTLGPNYADPALAKIREAVRGNGLKPEMITLTTIKGETAVFDAKVSLVLRTRTVEKIIGGKKNTGEKVDGPNGIRAAIDKERLRILGSEETLTRIKKQVMERKDMGLGTRNEVMKLPLLTREYVRHQPCLNCGAQGQIHCQRCGGRGHETCSRCHAQGMEVCTQCRGAQLLFNGTTNVPCSKCNGQGRTPCQACNQMRKIPCNICHTKGMLVCQTCKGLAWQTYITTAEMDVLSTSSFAREQIPDRLNSVIESKARELPALARVEPAPQKIPAPVKNIPQASTIRENAKAPPAASSANTTASTADEISLDYNVHLPYADAEFRLGKAMNLRVFLLGTQAGIADTAPFLEKVMENGLKSLSDAAAGRGNVAAKIQAAGRYRTIRQAIIAGARYSKGKAARLVAKNNPLGLSAAGIKSMVIDAENAMNNITAKPRRNGAIGGALIAGILYGLYFVTPARGMLTVSLPDPVMQGIVDAAVAGLGMALAVFAVKAAGTNAAKKALGNLLPGGQGGIALAKAGHAALWAVPLCAILFLAAAELSVQMNMAPPQWYLFLRNPNS